MAYGMLRCLCASRITIMLFAKKFKNEKALPKKKLQNRKLQKKIMFSLCFAKKK